MFKKHQDLTFPTREALANYLAMTMRRNRPAAKRYPNSTIEEMKTKHFDIRNAISRTEKPYRLAKSPIMKG